MRKVFGTVLLSVAMLGTFLSSSAIADVGPENTVVVVNSESWASMAVANEFIHLRDIPTCNVIYLKGIRQFESITVEQFREQILKPVLETIKQRGLTAQIDCVAYSSDIPYAINVRGDVGKRKFSKYLTPTASLNGMTYLYEQVLAKDPNYLQLSTNFYNRLNLPAVATKPPTPAEQKLLQNTTALLKEKKWKEAETLLLDLLKKHPELAELRYNLACVLARQGRTEDAIAALTKAVENGWHNDRHARNDDDLKSLHKHKEFQPLLKKMRERIFSVQPTEGFRSSYRWNSRGVKVDDADKRGRRYLLSVMLAVTSGRGNSVSEAIAGLRRSATADGTHPQGKVYYMINSDVRTTTRLASFPSAIKALKDLGVPAEILKGDLPENKHDVVGVMAGRATLDWKKSKSIILPGAICEHLTSAGGVMRQRASQTPLSEFLRYGSAGSSGTVTEPFALQAKFPHPFIHAHYATGSTLVESFYQSLHGPYQLLIVGDPLCRPWANIMAVNVAGIKAGGAVAGKVNLTPSVVLGGARKNLAVNRYELYVDGKRVGQCKPGKTLLLDSSVLADGYHEASVVMVAANRIETQARLKLPFVVNNHPQRFQFSTKSTGDVVWGQPITINLQLPGATKFTLRQHNRELASVTGGEQAKLIIDSSKLGMGPVTIQAEGAIAGKAVVSGTPISLNIVPPPALPAMKFSNKQKLVNGLLLTLAGGEPIVVQDTISHKWLMDITGKPKQPLKLTGIFEVGKDDVYQFQLSGNCKSVIRVDGKLVPQGESRGWKFMPIALKAGKHRLEVTGTTQKNSFLQLRFGGRGAQSLEGKRFQNVKEGM